MSLLCCGRGVRPAGPVAEEIPEKSSFGSHFSPHGRGSRRLPSPTVVVLAHNRLAVPGHPGRTMVRVPAVLTRLVAGVLIAQRRAARGRGGGRCWGRGGCRRRRGRRSRGRGGGRRDRRRGAWDCRGRRWPSGCWRMRSGCRRSRYGGGRRGEHRGVRVLGLRRVDRCGDDTDEDDEGHGSGHPKPPAPPDGLLGIAQRP